MLISCKQFNLLNIHKYMYVYFNKRVYTQFMPKNISKCRVSNKEKSFHFVNNKKWIGM